MPNRDEWKALIDASDRNHHVTAESYRGIQFASFSAPVVLGCSDGEDYVVKSPKTPQLHRAICNDQVMGHVATALLAPVPVVKIVNIPQSLINGEPALRGILAGPAHGSRYMPDVSKTKQGISHVNVPANRDRFALLAVMYGLAGVSSDHQFFYQDGTNLVWSFDHGHFFPGGPDWTTTTLAGSPPAAPDQTIVQGCGLTSEEIEIARRKLALVSNESISRAVASLDDSWGITSDERVALAEHLSTRRDHLSYK